MEKNLHIARNTDGTTPPCTTYGNVDLWNPLPESWIYHCFIWNYTTDTSKPVWFPAL